jgi:hypothetical protein
VWPKPNWCIRPGEPRQRLWNPEIVGIYSCSSLAAASPTTDHRLDPKHVGWCHGGAEHMDKTNLRKTLQWGTWSVTYNQQFTKQISRKNKNPEYRILITIYILPFGFYCLFFLKNIDYIEKSMFDFLGFYNCFYIDFYFVFWCVSIDLLFFWLFYWFFIFSDFSWCLCWFSHRFQWWV